MFLLHTPEPSRVEHPEWICRDQNGNPMTAYMSASPGLQAVRDYTINVAWKL